MKALFYSFSRFYNLLLISVFTFTFTTAYSQKNDDIAREIIRQRIEELSSKTDIEYDFSELYDHFIELYEHPININKADANELRELMFLNDNQIAILLDARNKKRGFSTIYELKDLDGFYVDLILSIEPFITFDKDEKTYNLTFSNMLKYGKNQVLFRYGRVLEQQQGYLPIDDSTLAEHPNSRYLGDKNKVYLRYKYTYSDRVSFGFLGDKDAGEEMFNGNNTYGFDFYSAHFFLKNQANLKALAIGDYHLEFGQGLTMWSGLSFGKSVMAIDIQRQARGLRANTSANEVLFFRGAAATYQFFNKLDLTIFYSNKNLDAGLDARDTSSTEDLVFSGIQESGLHRTTNEMAKKRAVNEQIIGSNLSFKYKGLRTGFTAYKTIYDKELYKDIAPYQYFDFQGKDNFNMGLDASYANKYLSVFGEAAISANGGKAVLLGSIFNLHPRLTFSLFYRNFQEKYQAFYAIPISEGGKAQNEEGIYLGALLHLGTKSDLRFYYDIFKFPWLRYRINSPSYGNEFSMQYERRPSRYFSYYIRYQFEDKFLNLTDDIATITEITNKKRHNIRFHLSYSLSHQLKLQSRLNLASYQQQPLTISRGYLLYQDVQYSLEKIPLKFSFRYAVFNTDDYNSRIYAYENDVLYKFSVPGYYYQGQRYYILANYNLNNAISMWIRFSQTIYNNRETISSGLEEINGNRKSEITVQLRWAF